MSNESENKRIDLTQFEGMTKGPWHFAGPFGGMMLVTAYPHDMIVRQNGEGDCRLRLGEINSPYDGEAIAQLPDLIAELKRCYEELDEYDKLVGLLIENHFVETSPYETIKHLIETHQDYRASE